MSVTFRWLGVAGVELKAGGQVLAIDPFFTRPSLQGLFRPVIPNEKLIAEKLPECSAVLVTHSHWDHLMDVPSVMRQSGAATYGSPNTCRILRLHGIADKQVNEVSIGDKLVIGAFEVEVVAGQHSPIPFGWVFNGALPAGTKPPLRLQDYRMDVCLGYCIQAGGVRVLICAAQPQPADALFAGTQETKAYYSHLLEGVHPHTFVPIHWDDFTRPLDKSLRRFTRPGRMSLEQLTKLAVSTVEGINVLIPEMFREYTLMGREIR